MPEFSAIYYSDGDPNDKIIKRCGQQLHDAVAAAGGEIITVTWHGAPDPLPTNLIWKKHERSVIHLYNQILAGVAIANSNIVFLTEHDVLYHEKTFREMKAFVKPHALLYNHNVVHLSERGYCKPAKTDMFLSALAGEKDTVLKAITDIRDDPTIHLIRCEPMKPTPYGMTTSIPSLDIRHGRNFTGSKTPGLNAGSGFFPVVKEWGHYRKWLGFFVDSGEIAANPELFAGEDCLTVSMP